MVGRAGETAPERDFVSTDEDEDEPAYIARAACGCIVMAIADDEAPDWKKHTANEIAKAIRRGLSIERVPAQYVRDNMKACPHKREIAVKRVSQKVLDFSEAK
jgi:hypothetical protein